MFYYVKGYGTRPTLAEEEWQHWTGPFSSAAKAEESAARKMARRNNIDGAFVKIIKSDYRPLAVALDHRFYFHADYKNRNGQWLVKKF